MRFLLLGGTSQVGAEFRALAQSRDIEVFAPGRSEFNLESPTSIKEIVGANSWNVIINAAAYTDVDGAEKEETLAFRVNAELPSWLASEASHHGTPIIHLSTDYVFDGRKGTPYLEEDEARPINTYGRSKLAGEDRVRNVNPRHVILRTSWVYSPHGRNFVKTILRLANERNHLTVVADQRGCPTAAADVAAACLDIAMRSARDPESMSYGIYHLAGSSEATWFEFATAIVNLAADRIGKLPKLEPIRTIDYPAPAARPLDTRLCSGLLKQKFGLDLRAWRDALPEIIDRLLHNRVLQ